MVFDDKAVEERLKSSSLLSSEEYGAVVEVEAEEPVEDLTQRKGMNGKSHGPQLDKDQKRFLGMLAYVDKRKEVAKNTGVSAVSIDHFSKGRLGYARPDEESKNLINQRKDRVQDQAIEKLMTVINLVTDDKLEKITKAKDLTSIAKDLSIIVGKVGDQGAGAVQNNLIFYSPNQRDEEDYKVVDV